MFLTKPISCQRCIGIFPMTKDVQHTHRRESISTKVPL